jgi:hypothetical protein
MLNEKEKQRRLAVLFDLASRARAEGKLEEALALEERRRKLNIQPTMVEPWVEV